MPLPGARHEVVDVCGQEVKKEGHRSRSYIWKPDVDNWLQQVEEDVGLSVGAAWIAGQDRSMWRTLRPSAGQAQQ